jgi:hypothetical protein
LALASFTEVLPLILVNTIYYFFSAHNSHLFVVLS